MLKLIEITKTYDPDVCSACYWTSIQKCASCKNLTKQFFICPKCRKIVKNGILYSFSEMTVCQACGDRIPDVTVLAENKKLRCRFHLQRE